MHATQIGFEESIKQKSWEDMENCFKFTKREDLILGETWMAMLEKRGIWNNLWRFRVWSNKWVRRCILDFTKTYDLILMNTWFKKRDSHLISFKSGTNISQIDFILTRKVDRRCCKDYKAIPGESITTQHWLAVPGIYIRRWKKKKY